MKSYNSFNDGQRDDARNALGTHGTASSTAPRSKTFRVALGGIYLALTIIFLFGASFVPGIEISLFTCASFFTAFMLLETNVAGAAILFAAASLLGFFVIPNKLAMIPYVFFFGYYGIVKFYIENIPNMIGQIVCKVILFAGILSLGFLGFMDLISKIISMPGCPIYLLIVGCTLMLLTYDYIYTGVIDLYIRRVQRRGITDFKLS